MTAAVHTTGIGTHALYRGDTRVQQYCDGAPT